MILDKTFCSGNLGDSGTRPVRLIDLFKLVSTRCGEGSAGQ